MMGNFIEWATPIWWHAVLRELRTCVFGAWIFDVRGRLVHTLSSVPSGVPMFPQKEKPMKTFPTYVAILAVMTPLITPARPPEPVREAAVRMASRSLRLGEGTGEASSSLVFSTPGAGARFFGNGEVRPSATRDGFHESAFTFVQNGDRLETGDVSVQLPATDANANGIPDVLDTDAAVDVTLSAEFAEKNAATGPVYPLRLQRGAGSDTGTYTVTLPAGTFTGSYSVIHSEGSLEYQRTDNGALLNFDVSNATTNARAVSRVLDADNVKIAAFRFRASATRTVRVAPTTLARHGTVYQSDVQISDGLTETPAPDFRWSILQITDTNDRSENGVPDFSDALPPYIAVQPTRRIVPLGSDVVLSVVVEGTGPFTYEWQQNGHELSNPNANATSRVLVIPNATIDDKGSYRVRVSNAAGSVWSDSTSVSFLGQ